MLTDVGSLRRLRSLIQEDDDGTYMSSRFVHLEAAAHVQVHMGREDLAPLHHQLIAIRSRVVDLEVICSKLDWMRQERNSGELDRFAWMFFASNDVVSFLMHARSLLDHLARALRTSAIRPGNVPGESFRKLRKWAMDGPERAEESLGSPVVDALAAADWFPALRALRDGLVHSDHRAIVFPGHEGESIPTIPVQIWTSGHRHGLAEPALLDPENPNIAIFERLATVLLARTLDLLEDLAAPLGAVVAFDAAAMSPRARHGGLQVIRSWLDEFLGDLAQVGPGR